ncbi:uncharacterized protein BP01DRAFT_78632 [Aspergillus saccharolyticus JOP 1030-1]|uniref:Uncharacterized protein n=1 Tax=Aspergillus saccharolyticus JOP 1030-1 TaxID=1450539 RepID=A0A319ATD5_9EURO|nr:hypothetical protein BP01DRAFT_78632 [Aspergillus saccharolyticus JOP 1030-1]PYH49472.1 hypothetical protein BP01DRAFT_78632 [Aspergillus saccharolyticus JOP 1030-1]
MAHRPEHIIELNKQQLRELIKVLKISTDQDAADAEYFGQTRSPKTVRRIKAAIQALPTELYAGRSRIPFRTYSHREAKAAVLCDVHEGLNGYVIGSAYWRLRQELTDHLRFLEWYHEFLSPEVKAFLEALTATKGMWWVPETEEDIPPKGAVCFQENCCQACMLARVVVEPWCLFNVRTALVSRVRTRKRHRVPALLPFIEIAIREFAPEGENIEAYGGLPCDLAYKSSALAYDVKKVRKHAAYCAKRDRKGKEARESEQAMNGQMIHRPSSRPGRKSAPANLQLDRRLPQAGVPSTLQAKASPMSPHNKQIKQHPSYAKHPRPPHCQDDTRKGAAVNDIIEEVTRVHIEYAGHAVLVAPSHTKCNTDGVSTVRPLLVKKQNTEGQGLGGIGNSDLEYSEIEGSDIEDSDIEDARLDQELQALRLEKSLPSLTDSFPSTAEVTPHRRAEDILELSSFCNEIALEEKALWTPTFVEHILRQPYHLDEPSSSESSFHTTTRSAVPFFNM